MPIRILVIVPSPYEPQKHSPYTYEGAIEGLGKFASNSRRLRGPKRWVITLIAVMFLAPFGFAVVSMVRALL